MSQRFLLITASDGTQFISEYRKLGNIEKYLKRTFFENKPLNVWNVVSEVHPDSGEAVLYRTRTIVNGRNVISVQEVTPVEGRQGDDYSPESFELKPVLERGQFGTWTAPTTEGALVVDARPGATYPIHRDAESMRRYVILKAGQGEDETRHYLDPERPPYSSSSFAPVSARDDFSEEDDFDGEDGEDNF